MRICVVTTWPPYPEGIALYSYYLYNHMSRVARVDIIANTNSSRSSFGDLRLNDHNRMRIIRCWRRGSLFYPLKIFRQILRLKPDIIHVQHGWLLYGGVFSPLLFPVLLLLLRLSNKPFVVTMHTIIKERAQLYKNRLINFIAKVAITFITKSIVKLSNAVIVHNNMIKKILKMDYSLEKYEGKIFVIPHGAKKASKKPLHFQEDGKLRILSLGFIRERKRIEYLIEAFENFSAKYPNAIFTITSGKHAHEKMDPLNGIKRILPADILEKIVFTGFINDEALDDLIWRSDIIVLYSVENDFFEASGALSRVALFGKTVVCSRVPKFEAELKDGENCLMVEPKKPESLVKALVLLANNVSLRRKLGENLKNIFRNREWNMVAKYHINLFERLLKVKS